MVDTISPRFPRSERHQRTDTLYVYGDKVLTLDNISGQEVIFDNDRDGHYDAMTNSNVYTAAIRSHVTGEIASSMNFIVDGVNSTGIIGFARGEGSSGIIANARDDGDFAVTALTSRAAPGAGPMAAIYGYAISTSADESVALTIGSAAVDGTVARISADGDTRVLMDFQRNAISMGSLSWSASNILTLNMGDGATRTGRVIGLKAPTQADEAVNKAYVDALVASACSCIP